MFCRARPKAGRLPPAAALALRRSGSPPVLRQGLVLHAYWLCVRCCRQPPAASPLPSALPHAPRMVSPSPLAARANDQKL